MGTITKYATTLEAIRDGRFQTNGWNNLENGVGNTNVATTSTYTTNFVPQQLYAHDFGISLPSQYDVESITFEVKIRGAVKNTQVPTAFFIFKDIGRHTEVDYGQEVYSDQPQINISDSYNIISYSISKEDVRRFNPSKSQIQSDRFGTVLKFSESNSSGGVSVEWMSSANTANSPGPWLA